MKRFVGRTKQFNQVEKKNPNNSLHTLLQKCFMFQVRLQNGVGLSLWTEPIFVRTNSISK